MALRRRAQTNSAAAAAASPRSPDSPALSPLPVTPHNRTPIAAYRSPASTPSRSSSVPFDWEAARSRRPPPYATPVRGKGRKSDVAGSVATPIRRVVRKKGIIERITSIPSTIAFELALFPQNVPLPSPRISARVLGGAMHLLHLCIRVSQVRKVPDSDLGWEDMYREGEGDSWLDWTLPLSFLLVAVSSLNALHLFTRIKLYRLHHHPEPVSSPNARFVSAQLDFEPLKPLSIRSRIWSRAWYTFSYSWRWLLGMSTPSSSVSLSGKIARVQQMEVWTPGELEMVLFSVYSPVHPFLWMATGSSNWVLMFVIMGLVGAQLHFLTYWFNTLLKDKEIIAAEVLNEYNQRFVYPRVNPIRRDVAVMTHQSEIVDMWGD